MTAQVIDFPVGANADDTIRATVEALLSGRGMTKEELADEIGVSYATMYRRLGGSGSKEAFKAGELASVARALGVHVGELYDGLGGRFVPTPPDGGTSLRARRDSNPKPSDPKVLPLPQRRVA